MNKRRRWKAKRQRAEARWQDIIDTFYNNYRPQNVMADLRWWKRGEDKGWRRRGPVERAFQPTRLRVNKPRKVRSILDVKPYRAAWG